MRVLLCSDIHGNAAALTAVLNQPADHVLCTGDLVHFGPQPVESIDLIRARADVVVQGNHDHGAAWLSECRAYGPWRDLDEASRAATDGRLADHYRRYLHALPIMTMKVLGRIRFAVVHAAPTDPLYRYLPPDTPDSVWQQELSGLDTDVLLIGHTHLPLVHRVNSTLAVNPGSVGLPRGDMDGAEYALWEDGNVTLHRVPYPQEPLQRAIADLPLPAATRDALVVLFKERRFPEAGVRW